MHASTDLEFVHDTITTCYMLFFIATRQTSQLCREVKSETGNCVSHVDILGYKLMFRALYKTVLFSEFIYIALKHSFDLY